MAEGVPGVQTLRLLFAAVGLPLWIMGEAEDEEDEDELDSDAKVLWELSGKDVPWLAAQVRAVCQVPFARDRRFTTAVERDRKSHFARQTYVATPPPLTQNVENDDGDDAWEDVD